MCFPGFISTHCLKEAFEMYMSVFFSRENIFFLLHFNVDSWDSWPRRPVALPSSPGASGRGLLSCSSHSTRVCAATGTLLPIGSPFQKGHPEAGWPAPSPWFLQVQVLFGSGQPLLILWGILLSWRRQLGNCMVGSCTLYFGRKAKPKSHL